MTQLKCRYGDDEFHYKVIYLSPREKLRRRKIAIHIHPNGSVQVDAPEDTDSTEIRQAVSKRARWVVKHLAEIRQRQHEVLPRKYISGESHFYLGRRYMLKVNHAPRLAAEVKLLRGCLKVSTPNKSPDAVKELLWEWYKAHAKTTFQRRLDLLIEQVPWARESPPKVRLLTMKRQWGSCSPKGDIILNPHLVKAPRDCIDYVILHELCHLQEHNHSPNFYRLLGLLMPEWQSVKAKLDNMSEILLNQ